MASVIKTENVEDGDGEGIKGRLSTETLKYFQRVEEVLENNTFEDEEHKEAFMQNVFVQIETDGTHLARHSQKTSRIIEKIIPCLSDDLFKKLTHLIQEEIDTLPRDRFASHVIETLCKCCLSHTADTKVAEAFVSFCKLLRKNCSVLIRDTYGCHVLSTVLQVLSGVIIPEVVTKSHASRKSKKKGKKPKEKDSRQEDVTEPVVTDVPRIFKKCFKKYVQVIHNDINFGELLCHRNASPVLQVMLMATSIVSPSNYEILYTAIVSRGKLFDIPESGGGTEDDDEFVYRLPVVFTDKVGSHLFEAVIKSANESCLETLGEKCFKRCILSLCIHPLGNYLAQTYLRCIKSSEHREFFVTRLLKFIEDILAAGNMGCIIRLAELINKFEMVEYQKRFITALSDALHIPQITNEHPFCKLVLCMMTYELLCKTEGSTDAKQPITEDKQLDADVKESNNEKQIIENDNINYHGCCILKNIFSFKKCKLAVESFTELTIEDFLIIASHSNSSSCIETFFQSKWIPLKSKLELGEMFLNHMDRLASDKWGSRVVDAMFKGVDDAMRERVRYVLRGHKTRLEGDLYGRIVLYNCGVKQHVDTMRQVQEEQERKRKKMFQDLISVNNDNVATSKEPIVKRKKKIDDRAAKYREQLASLGISFDQTADSLGSNENIKIKGGDEVENDTSDDLADVLQAIEASVQHQRKKPKLK